MKGTKTKIGEVKTLVKDPPVFRGGCPQACFKIRGIETMYLPVGNLPPSITGARQLAANNFSLLGRQLCLRRFFELKGSPLLSKELLLPQVGN